MFLSNIRINSETTQKTKKLKVKRTQFSDLSMLSRMILCLFFIFIYSFLGSVCIVGPQAQTEFFSHDSAAGFLWEKTSLR